jgi:hypothetical protein
MRPLALILLIASSIIGQFLWRFISATWGIDQRPGLFAYVIGAVLGYAEGKWTAALWDRYYIDALMGRVRLWDTFLGKLTTIFAIFALGLPIAVTAVPLQSRSLEAGMQSYVFGFIGGMNLGLYLWVRRLPR